MITVLALRASGIVDTIDLEYTGGIELHPLVGGEPESVYITDYLRLWINKKTNNDDPHSLNEVNTHAMKILSYFQGEQTVRDSILGSAILTRVTGNTDKVISLTEADASMLKNLTKWVE